MLPVPGGTFVMGSPATSRTARRRGAATPGRDRAVLDGQARGHLGRVRPVRLRARARRSARRSTGSQPATRRRPTPSPGRRPPTPTRPSGSAKGQPAICITHHAAMEYCRWLSPRPARPTACRPRPSGSTPAAPARRRAYSFGDDPAKLDEYAWYVDNAEKPQPIGKKKPNPWGLHDMHGNVAEWCLDHYVADLYSSACANGARDPSCCPTRQGGIPTWRGAARGTTTPTGCAAPPGAAPTATGAARTRSGRRASGGTPTPPSSASGWSAPSRSRRTSRASLARRQGQRSR